MQSIEVRYFATLRKEGKKKETIQIEEGITAAELADRLEIPLEDIAILLVNGIRVEMEEVIKGGDIVSIFPPVGGG